MARVEPPGNLGPHNIRHQGVPMTQPLTHTVTGATGYTGRYITKQLLDQGNIVQSITGHPERHNPFRDQVALYPFDFDSPDRLTETLTGTDTLFNTYWIRVNYGGRTHEQCVEQTKVMFNAAKAAGVRRIVHISITNPDADSDLPYFRGKGQLEDALRDLGVSYAILRPTVLYSVEDILLNNIAWTVRKFPLVLLPGNGKYALQPVFVEDMARLAIDAAESEQNIEMDAVGPEVFTYTQLVRLLRNKTGSKCWIAPSPKPITYLAGRALGWFLNDIVLTKDEIKGLSRGLLVSKSDQPAPAPTRLTQWLEQNAQHLGKRYANELLRHYR